MNKLLIQYMELKDNKQRKFGNVATYEFDKDINDVELRKVIQGMPIPKEFEGDLLAIYTSLFIDNGPELKGGMAIQRETFTQSKSVEGLLELIFANSVIHQVKQTIEASRTKKD